MDWSEARNYAIPIRFSVFVEEQGVAPEIELDNNDASCMHAVAFVEDEAVATGRLLPDGHIGRMAVLRTWRRRGIGGALLQALIECARLRGDRSVVLSAQTQALGFYRAFGFVEQGPEFMEAGIPHRAMSRSLAGQGS